MTELHSNDDHVIIQRRPTRYKVTTRGQVTYHNTFKDCQKRIELLARLKMQYKAEIV